ncbi:MBL fold metallo-hydrolase [Nocardioides sp. SR21]|uniref:MBL fold metallo-hydrolase n=1 Tax=Nocardioides sp. SR21 TaxID=2919501 RepID=UPI001FA97625|nr:MBL fold metallo-hydrolase [Nocardioides sp. SR21]
MTGNDTVGKLVDLGSGNFAYLQEGGSWGWSNAGLVTSEGVSLLVDTLFDLDLTRQMLGAFGAATPAAARIETLINTHNDGDHTHGNQLVPGARIIASSAAAEAMAAGVQPGTFTQLLDNAAELGDLGTFLHRNFGAFTFDDIDLVLPTETFVDKLTVTVGTKSVELIQVGPAHTPGDVIAYVPEDNTVFAGDILFNGSHPVIWAGPPSRWVDACDLILGWDAETIVPGHGPMATNDDVRRLKEYFLTLIELGGELRQKGLTPWEAAEHVTSRGMWPTWGESERLIVNFASVYQQLGDEPTFPDPMDGLTAMAQFSVAHEPKETIS